MRKLLATFLVLLLTTTILSVPKAQAEIPVRAKAFATIVGYGAAGGALLGVASMAFGTTSRAIAQGASLGLYAGIIFGTYVLVSHHNKRQGSYDDGSSPYQESNDIYGDEYQSDDGGGSQGGTNGGFFRIQTMNDKFASNEKGSRMPPLYLNVLNLEF